MNVNKIIMYLRKSRSDDEKATIEDILQRHENILQEYSLKSFGSVIPEHNIYREIVSGETIDDRPEIKKVLSKVSNGECDAVLVVEPQRLSRGDMLDCGTIIRVFQYSNTKVITPNKVFDLTEKYDRKFLEMDLQQGNDYLEYVKFILNRGRIASVKEGNFIGQHAPFGYSKSMIEKHHTLTPNSDADIVKLIFDMYVNKDMGCSQIASELDRRCIKPQRIEYWSAASIREMLRNPVYIGKIRWNFKKTKRYTDEQGNTYSKRIRGTEDTIIVDGLHPAIIDEEIFNKAQEKTGRNSRTPKGFEIRNPLATLVKCANCNHSMTYRTYKNSNGTQKNAPRLLCTNQIHCHTPSIEYDVLEKAVITALNLHIQDFEMKLKNNEGDSLKIQIKILDKLKKEYEQIEEQQTKLYELLEKGIYSDELFLKRNEILSQNREQLLSAIAEQENKLPDAIDYEDKIIKLSTCIETIKNNSISAKDKNAFLKSVIKKIEYRADNSCKGNRFKDTEFTIDIFLN